MRIYKISIVILLAMLIAVATFIYSHYKTEKVYLVGISQWDSNIEYMRAVEGFKQGLKDYGFFEGKNIRFLPGNPHSNKTNQANIVQNFIKKNVNLIYTLTTPGTLIAKKETNRIPIVFSVVTYPVEVGLIASLHTSDNNLVGTRNYISPEEQFYFFKQIANNTKSVAFVHRSEEPNSVTQLKEFQDYLSIFNVDIIDIAANDLNDLSMKLKKYQGKYDSIYAACDTLNQTGGDDVIIKYSITNKIPSFTCNRDGVLKGALIGDVTDFYSIGRVSGHQAAAILNGAKPAWLETESPKKGYIMLNMDTANILGLTIPKYMFEEIDIIISKNKMDMK